jgi:hypothetical protein
MQDASFYNMPDREVLLFAAKNLALCAKRFDAEIFRREVDAPRLCKIGHVFSLNRPYSDRDCPRLGS